MKGFVQYIITDGETPAEQMHYAKIPASLQQIDEQLLRQVQADRRVPDYRGRLAFTTFLRSPPIHVAVTGRAYDFNLAAR